MTTTIDRFPCEILRIIFNCLDSFAEMQICSHVNKRWRELCSSIMCNRNLIIETDQEATLFYWYLYFNKDKRHLIKHITVVDTGKGFEGTEKMLDLLTSSLETLDGKVYSAMFYAMFPNPEVVGTVFNKLKTIPDAIGYHNIYNKLLYNLRHSLEKIEMGIPGFFDTSYSNTGALGHLDQFKKLKSLRFNSFFHNIAQTEAIIKNCDTLHDLTIHLDILSGTGVPGDFDTWLWESVRQIHSLKTLKITIGQYYFPSLTKYLFYKYPNVETVIVEKLFAIDDWTTNHTLNILQDIKVKPKFILECAVVAVEIDGMLEDLKSENYMASKGDPSSPESPGAMLQVKSDPAMVNSIPSPIKRPAPLRVRYPTQEEILAAQNSVLLMSEDYSEESSQEFYE